MKKTIISGILLLGMTLALVGCGSSNSFSFKTTDVQFTNSEGAFAIGTIQSGSLKDGDVVTIKREGKTIKSVKVNGILKATESERQEVKEISKGDAEKVMIGLGDLDKDDISIKDTIVKEDN